jgi:RNA polymerase II subunit A C-terminal domain phosphatase
LFETKKRKRVDLDWIFEGLSSSKKFITENMVQQETKKLCLVLDLDETLVHTIKVATTIIEEKFDVEQNTLNFETAFEDTEFFYIKNKNEITSDHMEIELGSSKYNVLFRPHLFEFLNTCSKTYNLYLYTNGTTNYAKKVLEVIKKRMQMLDYNFELIGAYSRKTVKKGLKNLKKVYCKQNSTIIIDDREDVWLKDDIENLLSITPFYGDKNDKELSFLQEYLTSINKKYFLETNPDIRKILKM